MPLFGSKSDSNFLLGITRELIKKYIDTEVEIYKISLEDTSKNIYGEAPNKLYYDPMRVHSIIRKDDKSFAATDTGYDVSRTIKFGFIKDDLVTLNLVLDGGDIIVWDNEYYEVDIVHGTQYWGGRNPATLLGNTNNQHPEFGFQVSIIAEAHLTRQTRIQLVDVRNGTNDTVLKRNSPNRNSIYGS